MTSGPAEPPSSTGQTETRRVFFIDRQVSLLRALVAYGTRLDEAQAIVAEAKAAGQTRFEFTARTGPGYRAAFPAVVVMHWRRRGWHVDVYRVEESAGDTT